MTVERAKALPPFLKFLGVNLTLVTPDRVTAELAITEQLANRADVMHGGATMALADALGGTTAIANVKETQITTTVESKINFFAAIPIGDTAYGECVPLHRGRSTMVLQTRLTRGDGKLCALITQTQLVLDRTTKT